MNTHTQSHPPEHLHLLRPETNDVESPGLAIPETPRATDTFAKAFDTAWSSGRSLSSSSFSITSALSAMSSGQRPSLALSGFLAAIGRFLYYILPSFVQSRIGGGGVHEPVKQERIHPTAYLDGLRGVAAFAVFICHLSYQTFHITSGFGGGAPGENTYPIQLPFIRLFYSGPPMVAIFFVISGYALSYKPLKLMRTQSMEQLMVTMTSSVFRRPIRLFFPCFVSTALVSIMAQLNFYEWTARFSQDKSLLRAEPEDHAWTAPTPYIQFLDWFWKMFDFVHPWDWFIYGGSVDLDRHLWTIPTEFRASMVLFLTHFLVARMRTTVRLATLFFLIYWGAHWDRWEMLLFWSGCILAEFDLISLARANAAQRQRAHPPPPQSPTEPNGNGILSKNTEEDERRERSERRWHRFWLSMFVMAMYLCSYPDVGGDTTPGYKALTRWIPEYYSNKFRFWQSVGAVQIVWATNNDDYLKSWFTGPKVQYLGKISFALYLMHGPVIHTFGYMLMPRMWALTGTEPHLNYEVGFVLAAIPIIVMTVWAADLFQRAVDAPIVKFARWFENKCIVH